MRTTLGRGRATGPPGPDRPSPAEGPPGRWGALVVLAAACLLAMTTWFSASAVLPQLRTEWHLSTNGASLLTIAVQVGFVFGAVVSASLNLADLIAPQRLILIGGAGAASVNLLLVVSDGLATALPLRFATGAFLAGVYPPALKGIATWFRRGRGLALGVIVGALTLGSAAPHLVNGLGWVRWRVVIVVTSLLTLAGGLVAATLSRPGPYPFPRAVFDPRQIGRSFSDRGTRLAMTGYFGHMWELYAMWTWFLAFFTDVLVRHSWTTPARGAAFATFAVIGIGAVGCWLGGVLADRWGRTRETVLSMVVSGTCAVVIGLLRDAPVALVLAVGLLWGASIVADSAQFSTTVTELADQSYVGTAVTVQLAIGFTLTVLTIWLIPVLRDHLTWRWAFAFLALGPIVGTIAMCRLGHGPEAARLSGGLG